MQTKTSLVLIGSLVLNAALLGVVGGRMVGQQAPPAKLQLERYGPTSDVVSAAWSQLPDEDRVVLRKQMKETWAAMEGDRKLLSEAGKAVYDAALTQPYDEARLRNALIVFQQRERMMQNRAEDLFISHLGNMPPEARATAAVGLLTPFNARTQRERERQNKSAEAEGDKIVLDSPAPGAPPSRQN